MKKKDASAMKYPFFLTAHFKKESPLHRACRELIASHWGTNQGNDVPQAALKQKRPQNCGLNIECRIYPVITLAEYRSCKLAAQCP